MIIDNISKISKSAKSVINIIYFSANIAIDKYLNLLWVGKVWHCKVIDNVITDELRKKDDSPQ